MKTEWDYSSLAEAYLQRPDYASAAIDAVLSVSKMRPGNAVCDIGAGVAHLTLMLAARGLVVTSVEPNDAMRANGMKRTASIATVDWFEGTGEDTGRPSHTYDLVTFGSSFNVVDRPTALRETARILRPRGWFTCLWNHRRLDDPVQARIEDIIRKRVPEYSYGTRRQDQSDVIEASGLFGPIVQISSGVTHEQSIGECVDAWRSHATLSRQAGATFEETIEEIARYLSSLKRETIEIPYVTTCWLAQLK